MKQISQFAVQNYVVTPAALAVNHSAPVLTQAAPAVHQAAAPSILDQKWLIILSGVAIVDVKCTKSNDWSGETLEMHPDIRTPLQYAINNFSIPVPTDSPYVVSGWNLPPIIPGFQVEQYTINAALGSIYDKDTAVNAGFSINNWSPVPFKQYSDSRPNGNAPDVKRIYDGILVEVAVRDIDAWLYRVSFQINLLGKIIFFRTQGN